MAHALCLRLVLLSTTAILAGCVEDAEPDPAALSVAWDTGWLCDEQSADDYRNEVQIWTEPDGAIDGRYPLVPCRQSSATLLVLPGTYMVHLTQFTCADATGDFCATLHWQLGEFVVEDGGVDLGIAVARGDEPDSVDF